MQITIPLSSSESVITTPVGIKSIRSFYFVAKKSNGYKFGELPKVSITIDGKRIANNVIILPFCTKSADYTGEAKRVYPIQESRKVQLACNVNVDNSEIKIKGVAVLENAFEIVFDCSSTEVEKEQVDWVENKHFALKGGFRDELLELCKLEEFEFDKAVTFELEKEADKIFVLPLLGTSFTNGDWSCFLSFPTHEYTIVIDDNKDIMQDFRLSMLSPTTKRSWRDMRWVFNEQTGRYPRLTFRSKAAYSLSYYSVVVFFVKNLEL